MLPILLKVREGEVKKVTSSSASWIQWQRTGWGSRHSAHISLVVTLNVEVVLGDLQLEKIFIGNHMCEAWSFHQASDLGRDLLLVVVYIISRFGYFSEYSCCSCDAFKFLSKFHHILILGICINLAYFV